MFRPIRFLILPLALFASTVQADILWVGNSAQCTGSDTFPTLGQAVLQAAVRPGSDEIRLTNTVTYTGNSNRLDLAGWNTSGFGALTVAGGYNNCFGSQSGRSRIGDAAGPIVNVRAGSSGGSEVTLRNLVIAGSTSLRGLEVSGGSSVFLQNTLIESNIAGAIVTGGAFLDIDVNSRIQSNDDGAAGTGLGGGLRCEGADSEVALRGRLINNRGIRGGNLYAQNGCFIQLFQGAQINDGSAAWGGGAYIDNGASLLASGGNSRVAFLDNFAEEGAGLYVTGTGQATLINTVFRDNIAVSEGSAIFAINGGKNASPQVSMDRASTCPFLISCSEFEGNRGPLSTVYAENSRINIQRTLFDQNEFLVSEVFQTGTIFLNNASANINRVGFIGNETYAPIATLSSDAVIRHVTAVDNSFPNNPSLDSWALSIRASNVEVYNSIFADTRGHDGSPFFNFISVCNLVDNTTNWPTGSVFQGNAQFINVAGGDLRQLPSSPGVDMCNAQPGAPSNDRDLEFQLVPVNEFTNQQGNPGQAGGLWDAGVDEVYSTIGDDEFTLTVARNGSGSGFVISSPLGISCGSNCSETWFQGTLVTLTATPSSGSAFTGWSGCPLVNGNQCQNTVDSNRTITATFDIEEYTLSVDLDGPGSGRVVSSPAGIDCGVDCSEVYAVDTLVTLTATPDADNMFVGWIGCPLPNGNQCLNTVDSNRVITAIFDTEQFRLTVEKTGTGDGLVVSSPAGIDCGSDCNEGYIPGTMVTLTATAGFDSIFLRWDDCPSPSGNQCLTIANANRTVSARFEDEDVIFADQFE